MANQSRTERRNRPPRRVYRITEAGDAFFFQLLRDNLASHTSAYYPTDIGIAFMDQLPPREVAGHLRRKHQQMTMELEELDKAKGHRGPLRYVLEHNQRLLRAELTWMKSSQNWRRIEKWPNSFGCASRS